MAVAQVTAVAPVRPSLPVLSLSAGPPLSSHVHPRPDAMGDRPARSSLISAVPSVPCSLPAHLQQRLSLMLFLPAEKCSFNLTLRPATAHLFISVPGKRAQKPCLRC